MRRTSSRARTRPAKWWTWAGVSMRLRIRSRYSSPPMASSRCWFRSLPATRIAVVGLPSPESSRMARKISWCTGR